MDLQQSMVFLLAAAVIPFPGVKSLVEFYAQKDFTESLGEVLPRDSCSPLKMSAESVNTTECLLLFRTDKCVAGLDIVVQPGEHGDLTSRVHPGETGPPVIWGFRRCPRDYQGDKLRAKISSASGVLADFSDICDRKLLAKDVASSAKSIHSYGKCIRIHLETTRGNTPSHVDLIGGRSAASDDLQIVRGTDKDIVAIGPCDQRPAHCVRLSATVTVIEIDDQNSDLEYSNKLTDFPMSDISKFVNEASATTVKQQYRASALISESTTVNLVSIYNKIHEWKVDNQVRFTGKGKLPSRPRSNAKSAILAAYSNARVIRDPSTVIPMYFRTNREFSVDDTIEIGACSEYAVSSEIKLIKALPVSYSLTYQIAGAIGGRKMTADEIRSELGDPNLGSEISDGLEVSEDLQLVADFGMESEVKVEYKDIGPCP